MMDGERTTSGPYPGASRSDCRRLTMSGPVNVLQERIARQGAAPTLTPGLHDLA